MVSERVKTGLQLGAAVFLCLLPGIVGSLFSAPAIPEWYAGLNKPWFTPPNYLFGPVWTALYISMGISAFLIWRRRQEHPTATPALIVFAAQLLFNALWSPVFFGARSLALGLVVIILLWLAIAVTVVLFSRISKIAGLVLVPYLLWVSFATALNVELYRLNS